jgi:hypothetical protein
MKAKLLLTALLLLALSVTSTAQDAPPPFRVVDKALVARAQLPTFEEVDPALRAVKAELVAEGIAGEHPSLCDREVSEAGVYCHKWKDAINRAYIALESSPLVARDEFRAAVEAMQCLLPRIRDAERRKRLETILAGLLMMGE